MTGLAYQYPEKGPTRFSRWYGKYLSDKLLEKEKVILWCPRCHYALNGSERRATVHDEKVGQATYVCRTCGEESRWAFGIFPCPVHCVDGHERCWQEEAETC